MLPVLAGRHGLATPRIIRGARSLVGWPRPQLAELKALGKENQRLKRIVVDLNPDKLILKESLDFLKSKI